MAFLNTFKIHVPVVCQLNVHVVILKFFIAVKYCMETYNVSELVQYIYIEKYILANTEACTVCTNTGQLLKLVTLYTVDSLFGVNDVHV